MSSSAPQGPVQTPPSEDHPQSLALHPPALPATRWFPRDSSGHAPTSPRGPSRLTFLFRVLVPECPSIRALHQGEEGRGVRETKLDPTSQLGQACSLPWCGEQMTL